MPAITAVRMSSAGAVVRADDAVAQPRIVAGLEEPVVPVAPTAADDDRALDLALAAFRITALLAPDAPAIYLAPLARFAKDHPHSGWTPAVLGDLGLAYLRAGYASRAIEAWQAAWATGRHTSDARARPLVDKVVGELARLYARLGRIDELEPLLREVGSRPLSGPATEAVAAAREDAWLVSKDPAGALRSGPTALASLLRARGYARDAVAFLDGQRAGRAGFSLAQLTALADRAALRPRPIQRAPGQAVPVPSVMHWNHHFAAIVEARDGGYLVKDPTLGAGTGELWVSQDAIDAEASGFFLVPAGAYADPAWRTVARAEAQRIRGTGLVADRHAGATTDDDPTICPGCLAANPPTAPIADDGLGTASGVAAYDAHVLLASLRLHVTQSGYASLKGPPVAVRLIYNQREAGQPATFGSSNVSAKWTLNVLSHVEDNPASPGTAVVRHAAGGGTVAYPSAGGAYDLATGAFAPEERSRAILVRIPATGPLRSYELRMPDGGKQVFGLVDGASAAPRRVFLTEIIDAAGNAVVLRYDDRLRLRALCDAAGRVTRLSYEQRDNPLLVTRITDPFGRASTITYTADGRLGWSTNTTGLTSSFTYDDAGLVTSMTTPYGTTHIRHGRTAANARFLEIVDPMGFAERVESSPGTGAGLYWDRHVLPLARATATAAPDERKARRTTGSEPRPRTAPAPATLRVPMPATDAYGHALEYAFNAAGQVVRATDQQHRVTSYAYDSLGSLSTVTDPDGTTVLRLTYDAFDRVATTTNAAGYVLRYAYDDLDRLLTTTYPDDTFERYSYDRLDLVAVTDRQGRVTTHAYDANRRRTSVTDPSGRVTRFSYYDNGVLASLTDPDGATTTWGVDLQSRPVRHAPVTHVPAVAVGAIAAPATATVPPSTPAAAAPSARRLELVLAVLSALLFAGALVSVGLRVRGRRVRGRPGRSRQTSSTTWFPP
ncbi:MAG TPA: hypothetical protein VLM79_31610 [Kofleriaceae bacterium]|nr:hypothetical protein [Kofleriaceae bacterium]